MAWQKAIAQTVSVTFYKAGVPTAPTGGLTATISKDGAGFGAIGGTCVQVGATPCALLTLNTADTNCDTGVVKIVGGAGAIDDRYIEFVTEASYTAAKAALIVTMRGTDSAYTGTPPTAIAITTTVWAHASAVAIKVVTDKLATMLEAAGVVWRWTTGALINAPGAGSGDYSLTVTVVDGDGDPVADAVVTAVNTAGDTTLAGPLGTDTNGQRIFYRPDGETAQVNVRSTALIGAGTAAYTMAGDTPVTVTVALAELPVPTDPATYALYNDETDDHRVALGAGEAVIVLEWVEDAGLTDAEAGKGLSLLGKEFPTDATGRWSMNIPDFWAELGLAIRIRRTLTTITQNNESTWMATLVAPIAPATTINFAALAPDLFE